MIRSDAAVANDPQAPYYAALITPKHGIAVQWRPTEGAASQQINLPGSPALFTAPIYLMVGRYTDTAHGGAVYYTAYYSTDNVTWTVVPGSTMPLTSRSTPAVRCAPASPPPRTAPTPPRRRSTTSRCSVRRPAPPGLCPNAWQCADIGGAQPFGTQTLSQWRAWTISVGGSDLWNASDQFHMNWQTLPADGTVSAHVTAQSGGGGWAKGGVILRQTTDPASPYYGLLGRPRRTGWWCSGAPPPGATTNQIAMPGTLPAYLHGRSLDEHRGWHVDDVLPGADLATTAPRGTAVPGSLMTVTGPQRDAAGRPGDRLLVPGNGRHVVDRQRGGHQQGAAAAGRMRHRAGVRRHRWRHTGRRSDGSGEHVDGAGRRLGHLERQRPVPPHRPAGQRQRHRVGPCCVADRDRSVGQGGRDGARVDGSW